MEKLYFVDEKYEQQDYTIKALPKGDYDNCTFINCNFSGSHLSNINFYECIFIGCNLSMANTSNTVFRDVEFKDCKLLGLHFENCNEFVFSASFQNSILNLSSFYKRKIKNMHFENSILHEVDFTEADLTAAVFTNCDLLNAVFDNTNLEKTDFKTSFNFTINPQINKIKKAKFSANNIAGLLRQYDIEID